MELTSGHKAIALNEEAMQKQNKHWGRYSDGLVKLIPGQWLFPVRYTNFADKIYNFEFRRSDVVVMSYPKCGSTWIQEIAWTMKNNPQLDHPKAHLDVLIRSPFLDFDVVRPPPKLDMKLPGDPMMNKYHEICQGKDPSEGINLQIVKTSPDPRIIKTHMPFSLLPPSLLETTKVVYVARNPKDVIISYYHHSRIASILDYTGSFEEFVDYFLDGEILYGTYWMHLKEAWERRNHPNMNFIFYEDLKSNNTEELTKLNNFLSTNLTKKQLEGIVKYTSFQGMKERDIKRAAERPICQVEMTSEEQERNRQRQAIIKDEGGFYRQGEVGDWKRKLTPNMVRKVDDWILDNISSMGLSFRYDP